MTLKKSHDDGPHPVESRFIGSWMRMSFLLLLLFLAIGFSQTYRGLLAGEFRSTSGVELVQSCKEMKDSDLKGATRLDAALTLFFLEEISPECLAKEADVVLWENPVQAEGLGYLAKFAITEGDEQKKYYKKLCSDDKSGPCVMAHFLSGEGSLKDLSKEDLRWASAQYLVSEQLFAQGDFIGSLKVVEKLQKNPEFKTPLEKRFVRNIWALQEGGSAKSHGRSPSSVELNSETTEKWLQKFKDRYEIQ
jgi:hypothetical protein